MRRAIWLGATLWATVGGGVEAAENADLEKLLARPLIDPQLPLIEAQAFVRARIAKLPAFTSSAEWTRYADELRQEVLEKVVFRGAAAKWRDAPARVEWLETIAGGPGYKIRKLRYEALPGLWIPALLYRPDNLGEKVPVILNVNGHDANGKQAPYKQIRCINQAKRGMLALNVEWFGMGQLATDNFNHYRSNQIDLCGTSGLAPFVLSMRRALDILLSLPNADPSRVAVAGLSGGGWQTIVISSLDPRVTLADPVAGYGSYQTNVMVGDLGDSEQTPTDLASIADYAHLTAMRAPRPTLLTYNFSDNCCFKADNSLPPLLEAARPVYRLFGKEDHLRWHVNFNPGTHNFEEDNRIALYHMFRDFFYPGDPAFDPREIPSENEVKTKEQLSVPLPADNTDFHSIALALARDLPRKPDRMAGAPSQGKLDHDQFVEQGDLTRLCRIAPSVRVDQAQSLGSESSGDLKVEFWRLHLGDDQNGEWTIPAVEFIPSSAKASAVVIADGGRKTATAHVGRLLGEGRRVLAVDPFNCGESTIPKTPFLFDLIVASAGARPLGIRAAQIRAAASWLESQRAPNQPTLLVTVGPRSGVWGLVAVTQDFRTRQAIDTLECHDNLGSLKEVIERNWSVPECAELFCFGLLERFDLRQIVESVVPRPVRFVEPSERVRQEMAGLAKLYQLCGTPFDPLAAP